MRVKHWQGYGCVNMKKLKTSTNGNEKTIVVEVVGNHEYGLERNDKYDIFNWICKRFAKDCKEYCDIIDMQLQDGYKRINNLDTEYCIYTITYEI